MLVQHLSTHRDAILSSWLDSIVRTYPPDNSGFIRRETDPFLNPVGSTLQRTTADIYDQICGEADSAALRRSLDEIIRIRAVQDFSPSAAVAFVYSLKRVVEEHLATELKQPAVMAEWLEFGQRIDGLALMAFDLYVADRDKIHELRLREVRGQTAMLLARMNRIYGPMEETDELAERGAQS